MQNYYFTLKSKYLYQITTKRPTKVTKNCPLSTSSILAYLTVTKICLRLTFFRNTLPAMRATMGCERYLFSLNSPVNHLDPTRIVPARARELIVSPTFLQRNQRQFGGCARFDSLHFLRRDLFRESCLRQGATRRFSLFLSRSLACDIAKCNIPLPSAG